MTVKLVKYNAADAWEIRKRAEDRLGELSAAMDKGRPTGRGRELPAGGKFKTQALKAAGLSTSAANRYEQFNQLPAKEKERRIAAGRAAIEDGKSVADSIMRQGDKKASRAERERDLAAKQMALPDMRYGVIVADPEWRFEMKPAGRVRGRKDTADSSRAFGRGSRVGAAPDRRLIMRHLRISAGSCCIRLLDLLQSPSFELFVCILFAAF